MRFLFRVQILADIPDDELQRRMDEEQCDEYEAGTQLCIPPLWDMEAYSVEDVRLIREPGFKCPLDNSDIPGAMPTDWHSGLDRPDVPTLVEHYEHMCATAAMTGKVERFRVWHRRVDNVPVLSPHAPNNTQSDIVDQRKGHDDETATVGS